MNPLPKPPPYMPAYINDDFPTYEEAKMHIQMSTLKDRQQYKEHLIDEYIKAMPNADIQDIHCKADALAKLVYPTEL